MQANNEMPTYLGTYLVGKLFRLLELRTLLVLTAAQAGVEVRVGQGMGSPVLPYRLYTSTIRSMQATNLQACAVETVHADRSGSRTLLRQGSRSRSMQPAPCRSKGRIPRLWPG